MDYDNKKIGIYAPDYYSKFKCTADKCKHNCCINWEICIDMETAEKYKTISSIAETIIECEDDICFELKEDGRCPHLNENGLCNIIISHGEGYLSEICTNHPRFFNNLGDGRVEAGLGIVCEEACRLILENETTFTLSKIDEETELFEELTEGFYSVPYRNKMISIIENIKAGFDEKVAVLQEQFEIYDVYSLEEWVDRFLLLEILDANWPNVLKSIKEKTANQNNTYDKYYERLLVYFIYRHVSVAKSLVNLRACLAFSLLSVKIIRTLFELENQQTIEKLVDFARRYSAEIEYSENNTDEIIFEFECVL